MCRCGAVYRAGSYRWHLKAAPPRGDTSVWTYTGVCTSFAIRLGALIKWKCLWTSLKTTLPGVILCAGGDTQLTPRFS